MIGEKWRGGAGGERWKLEAEAAECHSECTPVPLLGRPANTVSRAAHILIGLEIHINNWVLVK